jgi:hypothetical protein
LASSFKHSSRFASYCLLAKGSYPCELNITLPFALVSIAEDGRMIRLMPGYWFEHNMYALVRNARKYRGRDKRVIKEQNIEYDFLAPDSAEEMIRGMEILRSAIEQQIGRPLGSEDFEEYGKVDSSLDLQLEGMAYNRKVRILHPLRGYLWYRKMLRFYGAQELCAAVQRALENKGDEKSSKGKNSAAAVVKTIGKRFSEPHRSWENIGGQLIPAPELERLIHAVQNRGIDTWEKLHQAYDGAWNEYPEQRTAHSLYCLLYSYGLDIEKLSPDLVRQSLEESVETAKELLQRAYASRRKDFENPYRLTTFRNPEEMEAVWGKLEDISFLKSFTEEVEVYCRGVEECLSVFS